MVSPLLHIDFDRNTVYESGAALMVLLTCPDDSVSEERRADLYASLCAKALWAQHCSNPDDCTPVSVKLQYVLREPKEIERDTKFVYGRLKKRLAAGHMAIPFFQRVALGRPPKLPSSIKRLSINQMAEAHGRTGSQRVDGYTSNGKGSYYFGGRGVSMVANRFWRARLCAVLMPLLPAIANSETLRAGLDKGLPHRFRKNMFRRDQPAKAMVPMRLAPSTMAQHPQQGQKRWQVPLAYQR
jgi:hypothetical protein